MDPIFPGDFFLYQTKSAFYKNSFEIEQEESLLAPETLSMIKVMNAFWIYFEFQLFHVKEEFEDTKGIIGIRKSKKNR